MDRQQAKELLPVIQAFAEGKTIQLKSSDGLWYNREGKECEINFNEDPQKYRIKPESKYRPFKNNEECWEEMQRHRPLGWIKAFHGQFSIIGIRKDGINFGTSDNWLSYNYIFKEYTFADGTPFGIKE